MIVIDARLQQDQASAIAQSKSQFIQVLMVHLIEIHGRSPRPFSEHQVNKSQISNFALKEGERKTSINLGSLHRIADNFSLYNHKVLNIFVLCIITYQ